MSTHIHRGGDISVGLQILIFGGAIINRKAKSSNRTSETRTTYKSNRNVTADSVLMAPLKGMLFCSKFPLAFIFFFVCHSNYQRFLAAVSEFLRIEDICHIISYTRQNIRNHILIRHPNNFIEEGHFDKLLSFSQG